MVRGRITCRPFQSRSSPIWRTTRPPTSTWIRIPVLAFVQHRRGTRDEPESEDPPASSFADQLRPLVLAAARRDLSVAERGRLELLLYAHWQDQLDLRDLDRPLAVA